MTASRRHGSGAPARRYPRSARVNEVLREVVAERLERLADVDERLALLTVTAVECGPDLRQATVLFSSLDTDTEAALVAVRGRLQAAIGEQVRLKRTPQLRFAADPAVAAGQRIEDILRGLPEAPPGEPAPPPPGGPSPGEPSAGAGGDPPGPGGGAR